MITTRAAIRLPCKTRQNRRQALLTLRLARTFPALYSQESKPEDRVPVIVKFFHPGSDWTFFATEANACLDDDGTEIPLAEVAPGQPIDDVQFFGLYRSCARPDDPNGGTELTYTSLREMLGCRGILGFERDCWLKPRAITLADARRRGA